MFNGCCLGLQHRKIYIYMDYMGLSENKTQKTPLVNHCIPGSRAINFGGMKNPQHIDIVWYCYILIIHISNRSHQKLGWVPRWFVVIWVNLGSIVQSGFKLSKSIIYPYPISIWIIIEGSLEVKLPTIWTDEKQSRAEAERRGRLEERRSEEKE